MSDIKPGTVVHIKVTDEPCFVLSVGPAQGFHTLSSYLSGVLVKVRRPTLDEHGKVEHRIEDFLIEELETKEDAGIRKVNEMERLKAEFEAQRTAKTPSMLGSSN